MRTVDPLFFDKDTTKTLLGNIGDTTLFKLLKEKKLKRAKLGNKLLITAESVRQLANELEAA